MSSKQSTVDFLVEQFSGLREITSRKMFGEYAIYCDGKVVALVCDDQLYIKPTAKGREFIEKITEKPPYPGAKPYFWIENTFWDDRDWMKEVINITAEELPIPKKKRP